MSYSFKAKIVDEPRRSQWLWMLGTDTVPLASPFPVWAHVPDHPDALAYLVDFEALDIADQDCVVGMLVEKCDVRVEEVLAELELWPRVPILAEGVIVYVSGGEGERCHG